MDDAEREYRRALALDADYATRHQWYGEHPAKERLDRAADWCRRWAELTGAVEPGEIPTLTRAVADATARPAALAILRKWEGGLTPRWLDLAFSPNQGLFTRTEGDG